MSPRNTAAAIIKMMRDVSCHRLLTTQETLKPLLDEIKAGLSKDQTPYPLSIEEVPPFLTIFPMLGQEASTDCLLPLAYTSINFKTVKKEQISTETEEALRNQTMSL